MAIKASRHDVWMAVIVGVTGEELNRFYERTGPGEPREKGSAVVKQGTGVAFMPEDLHSIPEERAWKVFPPHSDIREARA